MSVNNSEVDGVIAPAVPASELEEAAKQTRVDEGDKVQLIAMTMKGNSKVQIPVARGFKFVTVPALGLSPDVTTSWAKKIMTAKRVNNRLVRPPLIWHLRPGKAPKRAEAKFFEREGRRFNTDVYAPPEGLVINGRTIHHSVSQAQHFISRVLRTKEAIHRFIVEFDTRPDVAAWGNYVITQKEAEERENLGIANRSGAVV